jgi:hypothetical protein
MAARAPACRRSSQLWKNSSTNSGFFPNLGRGPLKVLEPRLPSAKPANWCRQPVSGLGPSELRESATGFLQSARLYHSSPAAPDGTSSRMSRWNGAAVDPGGDAQSPSRSMGLRPRTPFSLINFRHIVVTFVTGFLGPGKAASQPWWQMISGELHCCIWSSMPRWNLSARDKENRPSIVPETC